MLASVWNAPVSAITQKPGDHILACADLLEHATLLQQIRIQWLALDKPVLDAVMLGCQIGETVWRIDLVGSEDDCRIQLPQKVVDIVDRTTTSVTNLWLVTINLPTTMLPVDVEIE